MADIWMDVDAALAEVPVNIMPLIDDGDFKSREVSVAYNAAGMDLVWNFVSTAGAFTQTAVTPTTSGDYDWTNQGDGMYSLEIPASGGASINNDTEGFGWFTGFCTGVLPWRGPIIGLRAAALNNSLIDAGTTGLLAPTTAARTLDVTAGGNAGIDWANVENPTTTLGLTGTTISTSQVVASVTAGVTLAAAAVQAIWDALTSALTTVGSIGKWLVDNINATISSRATPAQVNTEADLALADVGLTTTITGRIDAAITTRATPAQILTTALTEAYAADGAAATMSQLLYAIQQFLQERVVAGTTVTVAKLDGTTTAMTFTLDSATVPTSITRAT